MKPPSLTLGIEEEYQIVDPETRELRSYITQILKDGRITVEGIKPELHQSVVEVGSSVCRTPGELRGDVTRLRKAVADLAGEQGLRIMASGTHPFASWMDQQITPLERYLGVEQDLQDLARKNLIFGMHVHVGIEDASKIWWDVRPHHLYPTLEFRICDMCTRVDEVVCIAAIFQAIVAKMWKLRKDNLTFRTYPLTLLEENKWRAVRYGLDGNLIDLGEGTERPARELVHELIDWFLDDVLDELGSRAEVEYAYTILEEGSSADRQLRVFAETGELDAVVDHLLEETAMGCCPPDDLP